MRRSTLTFAAAWLVAASFGALTTHQAAAQDAPDPRLREVWYDPQSVVTVFVKRGVVTDIVLDANEAITDVASGLGADCAKPDSSWCVAAQPGGRHLFVKPKSTAGAANNIAVVTDKRTHSFRFVVLADRDARQPVYRLSVKAATPAPIMSPTPLAPVAALAIAEPSPPSPAEFVKERLTAAPQPVNSSYSIAEGKGSEDIVPTLVFDDGRFTYLRFPNNREVPAIFHVLPDGSETVVNARMEGDLLVADRVSRRLMLRAGSAVVGVWNDAFDLDGVPPSNGTTVSGVDRSLKSPPIGSGHGGQR
jgi:type IV secretion system protein VirB9